MGRAFATALCEAGASVAVAEVNPETGAQAAEELRAAGHDATFYRVDVREAGEIQTMIDDLVATRGSIDILVNNAGLAAGGPSEEVTQEEWDRIYGVMLDGLFRCSQLVGRVMIGQHRGSIVNICSMAGVGGWAKRALYTPAKAGAIAMTQVLGVEWARFGIRVNGINPGQIETPLNEYVFSRGLADRETFANRSPMRRFGTPEEVAQTVLFLASDESSYVTAEVVTVDGGWLAWGGIEEPLGV
jgi:NAD(P)-dependent dehydrogenase (short-subunit alcohol dehydrogenase family)